eukprot:CAMPEP_0174274910 /NCGR_PEP_ID=MMETSP0439-20130205/59532_1 /TAXON_ID=0 /ORGANISM="Stereomyxa ramosa, Strain Chinc5" /LENGTH=1465 /DNA_ID=CAMNT_0015366961 /DNA_START=20 /DNA_END=4417 /DNA_ORIENTATION=+
MMRAARGKRVFSSQLKAHSTRGFRSSAVRKEHPNSLILEDGSVYAGKSFGAEKAVAGEVVFNTGMVGYPENLTDPSYAGQILMLTYPLVGNYGVPAWTKDKHGLWNHFESDKIQVSGLVVANYSEEYSHWNAEMSLGQWLKNEGIPAITGVDTRAVTKRLRSRGCMLGKLAGPESKKIPFENPNAENLVHKVSIKEPVTYGNGDIKIICVDCGVKTNIIRCMVERGATVKVVPWDYDFTKEDYDGLFISNGPGDPAMADKTVQHLRNAVEHSNKPIFGICLGNQLLARSVGAETYKLPYGNRGQNQPCTDQITGMCYITPQNHGFAVDNNTLPEGWKPSFINATDGSNEGIICVDKPFFSTQFHPEARGGPYDTGFLFDKFLDKIREGGNTFYTTPIKPSKKTAVKKALVLGSGGLQIGQAGEFDYSGSQAIKALLEEGVRSVLVNPNIATVQTAPGLADQVYFLPVTPHFVTEIIKRERPEGVLLGFGGQSGLNVGVSLFQDGVFDKYGVEVLGTPVKSIIDTEDRDLFAQRLGEIGVLIAESQACDNVKDAIETANRIGYPVMVRSAYALGGLGSGFCKDVAELKDRVRKALGSAPQVLVEKSLKGWKEVEYEVVRDMRGNCVTVCNMENFDPMGIHTGESIVLAPSQTLSNEEYHKLRSVAIKTVSHMGIVGECNIQYALDPYSEDYRVIEINARLSRSSALASKATGYPLAFVAAKLSLGMELPSLKNAVTKDTTANFEPALDYIVAKMPRWDVRKFRVVDPKIGSSMKSVGEVMAVGRSFEEAIQKAIRMVDVVNKGFEPHKWAKASQEQLDQELFEPTEQRIFALAEAFKRGYTVDKLHDMTKIDRWFLHKLKRIDNLDEELKVLEIGSVGEQLMKECKRAGFSDSQIAARIKSNELTVRDARKKMGVVPVVKQIDTLAAEFPAKTNYLYCTYNGDENDVPPSKDNVVVLGSGVYRIGSSVEFDYCGVQAIRALERRKEPTVMINYNPETVSTDYDESGKLYFEELSFERVADICDHESPKGVIVSVGGQQPNNIAMKLHNYGMPIMGTTAASIDNAEDRDKFSATLDRLGVAQPEWSALRNIDEAKSFCAKVGYPVLVRPSYVLSGAAMNVVDNEHDLESFLGAAVDVSPEHPVVVSKFISGAKEIECDAVCKDGELINWAISEHVENAGVHSGDATMFFPTVTIPDHIKKRVRETSAKITRELNVNGPVNVQFLYKDDDIKVIECNLRASRSFPFVSKVLGLDFINTAASVWLGDTVKPSEICEKEVPHYGVKAPQFSWQRLLVADPRLGVEMASTGEVACFGDTHHEAYLKALLSSNFKWPARRTALLSNVGEDFVPYARTMSRDLHYKLFATPETAEVLKEADVDFIPTSWEDDADDGVSEILAEQKVDFVVNFPEHPMHEDQKFYRLRRRSVDYAVPLVNDRKVAEMLVESLDATKHSRDNLFTKSHYDYVGHY